MFQPLSFLLILLLTACGGSSGGSGGAGAGAGNGNNGGGGGSTAEFQLSDRAGTWRGTLVETGNPDLPFGLRFSGSGGFERVGAGYLNFSVASIDTFSGEGALSLDARTASGADRIVLTANMTSAKDAITGTWVRYENGAVVASGDFTVVLEAAGARASDLAGDWAGDFLSSQANPPSSSNLHFDANGDLLNAMVGAQSFVQPFDAFTVTTNGDIYQVSIESLGLQRRYELVGSLNPQMTVFSGSWQYIDDFFGGQVLDSGGFEYQVALQAFPRLLEAVGGTWSGTASHPFHGDTTFEVEFDTDGNLVSGTFGEFGNGTAAILTGAASQSPADYSSYLADLQDEFSALGTDVLALEGVLSPVGEVWSGTLSHYFWGSCTFSLMKQ